MRIIQEIIYIQAFIQKKYIYIQAFIQNEYTSSRLFN